MLNESSKQRVKQLCEQIANEQDHNRFSVLIAELNGLLDGIDPSAKKYTREGIPSQSSNSQNPKA